MQKMKIDYAHCPMRKFWRPSLGCLDITMWESLRYPEKAALSALVLFVCSTLPNGVHPRGAPRVK